MVFSAVYCLFFSGYSALAVVLILGACESKRFTTAEYKKPQKQNRKVCIHVFYSTKFYLHFHISIFFPYLNVNQMLFLNCYLNPQSLLLDLRHYDSCCCSLWTKLFCFYVCHLLSNFFLFRFGLVPVAV